MKKGKRKFDLSKLTTPLLIIIIILLVISIVLLIIKDNRQKYDNDDYYPINIKDDNNTYDPEKVKISMQRALEIALNDLKIKEKDAYDVDIELENKYNNTVYEVSFNYSMHEYEYYIDATNGDIIHSFKELDF